MKKYITITLVLAAGQVMSQGFEEATERYTNLYDLKADMEIYFAAQRAQLGDSLFYTEGSEYNAYLKFLDFWEPAIAPHGEFDKYFEAEEFFWNNTGLLKGPGNVDDWYFLGPNDAVVTNDDNGIGPVEFITISETNTQEMLAGSLNGGLFYSSDGAENWSHLGSDDWENSGCIHAVFHPSLSNTYYAISGKHDNNGSPAIMGSQGKVKRRVGGSWETIGDYNDFNGWYTKYYKMLIDPLNSGFIGGLPKLRTYIATSNGLYYTDAGNNPAIDITWTKFTDPLLDGTVYDIEFIPNQTGTASDDIVVTVKHAGSWKLVYTTNRGLTWQEVPGMTFSNIHGASRLTIEVSKADEDLLFVYHADIPSAGYDKEVLRYDWVANTWTTLQTSGGSLFGSGNSFGVCQADVTRMGIDNGTSTRLTLDNWTSVFGDNGGHADVEDIVWHPTDPDVVFIANHGGVGKGVVNVAGTGINFQFKSKGLGIAEALGMATSNLNPGRVAFGTFHDGSFVSLNNYTPLWVPEWHTRHTCCDDLQPMIDYTDPDNVWLAAQVTNAINDWALRFWDDINIDLSVPLYNSTWESAGWEKHYVLNTEDPSIVYYNYGKIVGTTASPADQFDLLRSTNYGVSGREQISDLSVAPYNLTDYKVHRVYAAPSDPDVLYITVLDYGTVPGSTIHRMYRNENVNAPLATDVINTWEELNLPHFDRWVSNIAISFDNPNLLYISYSSDVFITPSTAGVDMLYKVNYTGTSFCLDGINCWNYSGTGVDALPNGHAGRHSIVLEKGTNEGIYFATNMGVYFSNASMMVGSDRVWTQIGTNLPNVRPSGLEINYEVNKIRLATYGRGIWEHDLYCPDDDYANETGTYTSDEFIEVFLGIYSDATVPAPLDVKYRAGYEIKLNEGFKAEPGCDFKAFIHPCDVPGNSFRMAPSEEELIELTQPVEEVVTNFSVRPNPTFGQTIIQLEDFDNTKRYRGAVYSMIGARVMNFNINSPVTEIDLSPFENGIYFLHVFDGEQLVQTKIVKAD